MKYNKHIVWLVPGFAFDETDDTCNPYLQVLLNEFHNQFPQIKISIIAFQYPFKSSIYSWQLSKIHWMNGRNKKGIFRFLLWIKVFKKFKKINEIDKVHLIHSFWFSECMLLGYFLSKRFKLPHFNTLMGQDVLTSNKYLRNYFYKRIATTALSKRMAEIFISNTNTNPIAIIPMGVEIIDIPKNFEKLYDIIGVGSLIPLKRYDLFLSVIAELKIIFPNIKVVLVGGGSEFELLKKNAEKLMIKENVDFKGKLQRKEVLKLMIQSKIFFHTSLHEGMGYVFGEAMHCGLPIVSCAVGCAEETEGWKIANTKPEMIELLTKLLRNNKEIFIEKKFPINKIAKQYNQLYFFLMDKKLSVDIGMPVNF